MPSNKTAVLLTGFRVVLLGAGITVAAATVLELAAMPPPPPESDGFAHGMAAIIGGTIILLSLGLAAIGVVLPTLLGRDDPLGFGGRQRFALKGAGRLIGGGILVGLAYGFVTELQYGIILWFGFVAIAVCVVCATLAWRLAEALVGLLQRALGRGAS
jgi:hypothetical protein